MSTNIKDIMETTINKIKEMGGADTITGDPIKLDNGISIIPVSKISYGFASGGSDFPSKTQKQIFGGGGGAGVTVTPVAFIVINKDSVKIMRVDSQESEIEKAVNAIPAMVDTVEGLYDKYKSNKEKKNEETL
ncbi:MAG: sporulation protein YtfJ [Clostridia bacterium]|nr:sporulation protein YtfJ [Clostridia bacterium]MEE1024691.1 spore germination protein GerW family protein [Acutalibacteraceae bacterium]